MKLYESSQDYLESILVLTKENNKLKSIELAKHMGITKQSVSRAVKNLKENNYINVDESGYITLSDKGLKVATDMYERHLVLTDIFIKLGVSEDTAKADACKVEHYISEETFEAIKNYINKK